MDPQPAFPREVKARSYGVKESGVTLLNKGGVGGGDIPGGDAFGRLVRQLDEVGRECGNRVIPDDMRDTGGGSCPGWRTGPGGGTCEEDAWPRKRAVLGVRVSLTDYEDAAARVVRAARDRRGGAVAALSIHSVVLAATQPRLGVQVNAVDMTTPDGQGVRWALNWLHGAGLGDRVYGPRLTLEVASRAAAEGIPVYLYGSTPSVAARLAGRMRSRFAGLDICGIRCPPFRPLTADEEAEDMADIRRSGAGIVLVGLGCPRQEAWVSEHRQGTEAVLMAVGAAFDFLSGNKPQAPEWVQRWGLEMVFRTGTEPRRLWRRLLGCSPLFVLLVGLQKLGWASFPAPGRIRLFGLPVLGRGHAGGAGRFSEQSTR